MKYLVVSDIHGSLFYANKLKEIVEKEAPDKLILLGDLYYSDEPQKNIEKVAEILNSYKDIILCIRGNCDSKYDEDISEFEFNDNLELHINGVDFFFTHGHRYNIDNIPPSGDVLVYGHFHTGYISDVVDGVLCVNSGSISLPRRNTAHSYLIIDNKEIVLKDISGRIIDRKTYLL